MSDLAQAKRDWNDGIAEAKAATADRRLEILDRRCVSHSKTYLRLLRGIDERVKARREGDA